MSRIRIVLADDHRIVLEGLQWVLEGKTFEIVGMVEDGLQLVTAAGKLQPDVVVADISMPHLNGIEAVRLIRQAGERIKCVILTMHTDVTFAVRAFEAGAMAYVLKHSASTELVEAIQAVLHGRTYVSPAISGPLIDNAKKRHRKKDIFQMLSHRQREILQLLAEGKSAREIARLLAISPRTVESHKYRLMANLQLKNSADLIRYAVRHNIVAA